MNFTTSCVADERPVPYSEKTMTYTDTVSVIIATIGDTAICNQYRMNYQKAVIVKQIGQVHPSGLTKSDFVVEIDGNGSGKTLWNAKLDLSNSQLTYSSGALCCGSEQGSCAGKGIKN